MEKWACSNLLSEEGSVLNTMFTAFRENSSQWVEILFKQRNCYSRFIIKLAQQSVPIAVSNAGVKSMLSVRVICVESVRSELCVCGCVSVQVCFICLEEKMKYWNTSSSCISPMCLESVAISTALCYCSAILHHIHGYILWMMFFHQVLAIGVKPDASFFAGLVHGFNSPLF